jgi:predicted DNA-binding antitoxin AbrB/MazE fold protein
MKVEKLVVAGVIKNGVVVPEGELPLPEGTRVDIVFPPGYDDIPEEFWQEMAMWDKASDEDFARWIAEIEGEQRCDEEKSGG